MKKRREYTEEEKARLESLRKPFDICLPETPQDKFHYMASKNQALAKLKDEFDLKFE
jgi:hypothetical protein